MMEQGCLHLPGRATIKATEYRELIEDRLSALNLLAEKNRELEEAKNRLEAKEEQIEMLQERLQKASGKLGEYERFFAGPNTDSWRDDFVKWQKAQAEKKALQPEGGAQ
ncbi:MAG: hypothetical protein IKO01_09175 [Kiritimatiellae bacterium]|nr:hypothetical protein [Kiritimatiellia bacterium]